MRERMLVVASLVAFGLLLLFTVFGLTTSASPTGTPTTNHYVYLPIIRNGKWWTRSRYMATTDPSTVWWLGCDEGNRTQDGENIVVVLDFGQPVSQGGVQGTYIFGSGEFRSTTVISGSAESFLSGFYNCTYYQNKTNVTMTLGIGTTNNNAYGGVTRDHGVAWAGMVNDVNAWLHIQTLDNRLTARGAIDIEMPWSEPSAARAWVDGYTSVYTAPSFYFDYGSCDGYPYTGHNYSCSQLSNHWTCDDVWYVAWGAIPGYPLPLIYTTDGSNASQWQYMSLYALTNHGVTMTMQGSFTQWEVCLVTPPPEGCAGANNSPGAGYTQLYTDLNSDPRTAQNLKWSTDISNTLHVTPPPK